MKHKQGIINLVYASFFLFIQTKIWDIFGTFYSEFHVFCYFKAFKLIVSFPFCFAGLQDGQCARNYCHYLYGGGAEFVFAGCHYTYCGSSFCRFQSDRNNFPTEILIVLNIVFFFIL